MTIRSKYCIIPATLLLATVLLIYMAPLEKSMGTTMRYIYVHVSLIWAGMLMVSALGLGGLASLFPRGKKLVDWLPAIGWLAAALYSLSVVISWFAAYNAWGRIVWSEPIYAVTGQIILSIILAQAVASLLRDLPGYTAVYILPAVFMLILQADIPKTMHPGDPIGSSDSSPIRLAFLAFFILALAWSAWILWLANRRKQIQ